MLEGHHDLQRPGGGVKVCRGSVKVEGEGSGADNEAIRRGLGGNIPVEALDYAAVLAAAHDHILASDVHAGRDRGNDRARGQVYHGGGGSGDRGGN